MRMFTSSAILAAALGISLAAIAPRPAAAASSAQTYTITAGTSFSPAEITVHAGQPVDLKFVGAGGVHGVTSTELGIPATMITPGSSKDVAFTPQTAGTYTLHCTIVCGPDHSKMTLVIHVVA